ncbi:MAG: AAA family ATPase [Clostridium sp.]|nr:AAA family ATPase [Clostridium sp.]MCM1170729.1 AAA family ATPase [Clostridium sp.]MCM1209127.1 AAA family ATPase [Ruminococcus sp.]
MAKKNILFVCFDDEYIITIEYKFAQLVGQQANVEFISEEKAFQRVLSMQKKFDIMILPKNISVDKLDIYRNTKKYYLIDDVAEGNAPEYIYKYYSVKNIIEKIDSTLMNHDMSEGSKGTKVVGVFSVAGGTGKTIAALSISNKLACEGKRVLYISTVAHQDFSYYLNCGEVLGAAFCYQCSINVKNALKIVQQEIKTEGFDFLPPFKNLPVSYQMTFETYVQIINYFKNNNSYDYIVVELSSELHADKLAFLKNCDRKIFITTQDMVAVKKLEAFLSNMLDFNQNLVFVCNRYKKEQYDYLSASDVLRNYEFSEFIEEYQGALALENVKNSQLFNKTVICIL